MPEMKLVMVPSDFSRVGGGILTAPVTLPVGKRIIRITYYYHHTKTGSPYSSLRIMRAKNGDTPEKLGSGSSINSTGNPIQVDVPIAGDPIIRAGYRYFVQVSMPNELNIFKGMKITFQQ